MLPPADAGKWFGVRGRGVTRPAGAAFIARPARAVAARTGSRRPGSPPRRTPRIAGVAAAPWPPRSARARRGAAGLPARHLLERLHQARRERRVPVACAPSATGSLPPDDITMAARRCSSAAGSSSRPATRTRRSETRLPEKQLSEIRTTCEARMVPTTLPMSLLEIQLRAVRRRRWPGSSSPGRFRRPPCRGRRSRRPPNHWAAPSAPAC